MSVSDIKKAQKESQLYKEISNLFFKLSLDDHEVRGLSLTRLALSKDKSHCNIFFYIDGGVEAFNNKLALLRFYKPSLRKAISEVMNFRYTPDLVFVYDAEYEKQLKVEQLIEKLKTEGQL